ncbi:tyrosine-protein phosphatase [soil metagenome]
MTVDRWIGVSGAHNVRDLGGLPLRNSGGATTSTGALYRADALDGLTADDLRLLHEQLGVRHVVDLRSASERAERGRGRLGDVDGVAYTEVEVIPADLIDARQAARKQAVERGGVAASIMAGGYIQLLDYGAPAFTAAVTEISRPGGTPALFHCAAGKDRTGVLAALLLEVAGVERDAIVADYALTSERLEPIFTRLRGVDSFEQLAADVPAFVFEAVADTMVEFLDRLDDQWGSAAGYLTAIGVPDDSIERIRTLLTT